jgi:2-polyprenyl-3-methyl-5-hydroxy-6-metoxy-1,4-benzoquinol methylase
MNKTKQAVELFDKYAMQYQEQFMNVDLYSDSLDLFCKNVNKIDAEILELACGPGNITKYLLNKRPDFKITGLDLSANMIALAKLNNPEAEFLIMDCRTINMFHKTFDGIVCGFCLPYLSKEETFQLFSDCSLLINPEGMLYISTMEDDYSKSGIKKGSSGDEIYQYFYQADDLIDLLKMNDFEIIKLERKQYKDTNENLVTDLMIVAKKT